MCLLPDDIDHPYDVADPWYTSGFNVNLRDVENGGGGLLKKLQVKKRGVIYGAKRQNPTF